MIEIRPCSGGRVRFAANGNANTVYAERHMACVSPFQDARYGNGMRLHTVCKKDRNVTGYRCTVCGFGPGVVRP